MTVLKKSLLLAVVAAAAAGPVAAEYRKVIDGVAINIGVVPAARLLQVDAYERSIHRGAGNATHHVVVGVADAHTGAAVSDAAVTLELVDPRGGTQRRHLERGDAGGVPDYSGLFRLGWSGDYRLRVEVDRPGARPVAAVFNWRQDAY